MRHVPSDMSRLILAVLAGLWLLAFSYAFVAFATTPPESPDFASGVNRAQAFLGWQGVAGIFALGVFAASRRWPRRSTVRRYGTVPLFLMLVFALGLVSAVIWATVSA